MTDPAPAATATALAAEPTVTTEAAAVEPSGAPAQPLASSGDAKGEEGTPGAEEDFSQTFAPVVELKEVETKTGEENEKVLFKMRSKLFRYDKERGEWKERGTGDVRFLMHNETKKVRLLMRRERTLKICMNHYVNTGVELKENVGSDRSWVFHAVDYADGERDEAMLAIRFANSENATIFKTQYTKAQEFMTKLLAGEPLPSEADLAVLPANSGVANAKEEGHGEEKEVQNKPSEEKEEAGNTES